MRGIHHIGTCFLATSLAWVLPGAACAQPAAARSPIPLQEFSLGLEQLAKQVGPCVVQVFAAGYSLSSNPSGPAVKHQSSGSGIILDGEGFIVTNAHVVYGARRIQVQLAATVDEDASAHAPLRPKGNKIDAQLVGMDLPTDLAVLRISEKGLPSLHLGDSNKLKQGQLVLAFGSPLGLRNTVTMGVVSAVDRQLQPDDPRVYVQTDAPINPGNSGGPLVNTAGEVVGINTLILSQSGGSEGVGLAIPSNTVSSVYEQLRARGSVQRGMIGVTPQTITPALATGLGLQQSWGVILADVAPDGPAASAGLKVGDVVLNVDGVVIEDVPDFGIHIHRHAINATVTLEVLRDWQHLTFRVPVVRYPEDPTRFLTDVDAQKNLIARLGIVGIEVNREIAALVPSIRKESGVLVVAISTEDTSPDDRMLPGDIIHAVNRTPIATMEELRAACGRLAANSPIIVQAERQGKLLYISYEDIGN